MRTRTRLPVFLILGVILLSVLLVPTLMQLAVDWLWFGELGMQTVMATELGTRLALFVGVGLLVFAVLYVNLRIAQRGLVPDPVLIRLSPVAPHIDLTDRVRRFSLPVAIGLSVLVGLGTSGAWLTVHQWLRAVPFGIDDPLFGRDIGFYVFSLPMLQLVLGLLTALAMMSLLLVAPIYWLRGDLLLPPRPVRVEPSAGMHLGALLAGLFVLTAIQAELIQVPELLWSQTGPLVGASYSDVHARLPGLRVSAVTALVAAAVVLVGAFRRDLVRYSAYAAAVYLGVALIGRGLYPYAIQRFFVDPTELTREAPFLERHISATRAAWGLDRVQVRELSGEARLSMQQIRGNAPTIENVRLWDREPLLQTFQQIQEIRTYYDFVSADDDRYWIDGRYRQVLLSPRELNVASLPTRTFINQHLTFTHGMGVTVAPVNQVTQEGLPVLFVQDLPPVSETNLTVTRPQIYYGELTNDFVIVGTRQREFDYPAGDENIFTRYTGNGGVPMGSMLRRALFASAFGSMKILLSGDMTGESRILFRRNVASRAARALPFLRFDSDPYMVVTEAGQLVWILDAYTSTSRYPYSHRWQDGTTYMRNSVKVTVDAYDGDIRAYLADPTDPIARTYGRIFPGILQPISEMPADLRAHLRYPEDLYRLQTQLYSSFHMDEIEEFYHQEDRWQIPMLEQRDRTAAPFMRRIIMRLPEEERAEFIFMTPYTPRGKDNLAAWMVARSDGEHYGELMVYRFPRQSLVFGPRQIVNRINQDTEIARQISLWDQRGSEVIRGELLVIPIEEALLYVQPIYLRAEGGRIPELKRVVLAYQNRVTMQETLDQALAVMFGDAPELPLIAADTEREPSPTTGVTAAAATSPAAPATPVAGQLNQRALEHYERALAAQRGGDWATYGTEIQRLGDVIRQLNRTGGSDTP